MNDQRVRARSGFGGEDPLHSRRIERMGAESVHGLGWERDESSLAQNICCARNRLGLWVLGIDDKYRSSHNRITSGAILASQAASRASGLAAMTPRAHNVAVEVQRTVRAMIDIHRADLLCPRTSRQRNCPRRTGRRDAEQGHTQHND
jgi:hypothetical protein